MANSAPTTAIDHALPITTSTPLPPAARPMLGPYNYPPSNESLAHDQTSSTSLVLEECVYLLSSLAVPQYSVLDMIIGIFMATSLVLFVWKILIPLIKLRIRNLIRIWPRTMEFFCITVQVIFGLDEEDVLWAAWMTCYKYFLGCILRALCEVDQSVRMLFGYIQITKLSIQVVCMRCVIFAFQIFGVDLKKGKPNGWSYKTWKAYVEADC